jgi:hypothetical protein
VRLRRKKSQKVNGLRFAKMYALHSCPLNRTVTDAYAYTKHF